MLDICLVQLPNPALATQMYHSLGILYLASVVEKAGYWVYIADLRNDNKPLPPARFYGFSCTTPEIDYARKLAKQVKGITIVGGGHPSLMPEDCLSDFDYVIMGEGEEVILEILSNPRKVKQVIKTPRISDLNKIPFPARHLIKNPFSTNIFAGERYGEGPLTATMIISRGCPFRCHFCGNIFYKAVTFRSVENIICEMVELRDKYKITHFKFMDDNFTLHPEFKDLCNEIKKLDIHYIAHTRSDLMTPEKAELLFRSGCVQSGLGVESADNNVLKINNKRETVEQHKEAIKILKEAGLRTKPYWMTGLPGETDETIELNKQFMIDTQVDKWTVSTFTPYPGCAIHENPDKFGVTIIEKDWSKYWNYCQGRYNHVLKGQTQEQMWNRYLNYYNWLKEGKWLR